MHFAGKIARKSYGHKYPVKTLYVSDLDGTLLRGNARTSDYTNHVINELTEKGMLFSYATARSIATASKAAAGLTSHIPLITYNGVLVRDNVTHEILLSHFFSKEDAAELTGTLLQCGVSPIVYAYDGKEHFSYLKDKMSPQAGEFLAARRGDERDRPVSCPEQLLEGEIFYFTCIDETEKMRPLYERYRERFHCFFYSEIYSGNTFFELIPQNASKAAAVLQLKELLGANKLVVFGDGENDLDMFRIADEAYAVSNASDQLKAVSTGVIGSNEEDSVAKWLEAYGEF